MFDGFGCSEIYGIHSEHSREEVPVRRTRRQQKHYENHARKELGVKGEIKVEEWYNCNPGFELLPGYRLETMDLSGDNVYCGGGGHRAWRLIAPDGSVVEHGDTCVCGRGCCNRDCIDDEYGYHDTVLEQYRADVES